MLHVMYSCNEAFVTQMCVSMVSLLENNQKIKEIQFHCVEDQLQQQTKEMVQRLVEKYHRQVIFYALKDIIAKLPISGEDRHPHTIYSKLCMGFLNVERLLYLDCDTVVTGSLEQLETLDMSNHLIAGVAMAYGIEEKSRIDLESRDVYICDGIVMFNMSLWREENKEEQAIEFIKEHYGRPPMLSEGVLNNVCREKIRILPPCYNLMSSMIIFNSNQMKKVFGAEEYYKEDELMHARKEPVIIHYIAELYQRPWYSNSDHPYRKYYQKYCKKIEWAKPMQRGKFSIKTKLVRYCAQYLPTDVFVRLRSKINRGRG